MAKKEIILDTSVAIDIFLDLPIAIAWSKKFDQYEILITSITVMEVLAGARNKSEMGRIGRFLSQFKHLHILRQDSEWAVRQFRAFWLSHQIGMADCLIAAVAARNQLPLYTLNLKDFEPLPDLQVIKPY